MFTTLQAYRGAAALMVVLYHTDAFMWRSGKDFHYGLAPLFDFFDAGVQLFFVLSGFIIFMAHRDDLGESARITTFIKKRLIRIYPAYIVVTGLVILQYQFFPDLAKSADLGPGNIIASFVLWPSAEQPIVAPAWTLQHEMLFYLSFALMILNFRAGLAIFLAWQAGCVVNLIAGATQFPFGFLFSADNLLFLIGIGAAVISDRRRVKYPAAVAALGAVLFLATGLHRSFSEAPLSLSAYILRYGLAGAFMIAGLVELERSSRLRAPLVLSRLGEASYAIYLIHCLILSLGVRLLVRSGGAESLPPAVSFAALSLASLAAGVLFHVALERPLTRALRRRLQDAPATPPSPGKIVGISAASEVRS